MLPHVFCLVKIPRTRNDERACDLLKGEEVKHTESANGYVWNTAVTEK